MKCVREGDDEPKTKREMEKKYAEIEGNLRMTKVDCHCKERKCFVPRDNKRGGSKQIETN